jgi:HEAT repeat protein
VGSFVVFSVWIEDRFPSNDPKRALLPIAQRAITKPVVNAISHQLDRYVRQRAEAVFMETGLTLDETIARFLDEKLPLSQRRIYAYRLARVGSPECITALLKVLQSAPPQDKAFMAQLVGSTGNPAAKDWLLPLLNDPDQRVVLAAIRGLSAIGGEESVARISALLRDPNMANPLRVEAAVGLGNMDAAEARTALNEGLLQMPSSDLTTQILKSLAQADFHQVSASFEQFLSAPANPKQLRVAAIEALAGSSPDAVPFLLGFAGNDNDADVRSGAAWAISVHESVKDLAPTLADLVEREPAADVRRRLYEALLAQDAIPAERLLPTVLAEEDIAARVAGFNAAARAVAQQPGSPTADIFDQQIVPELQQIATTPNSLNIQMRAVFALRLAQTSAAQAALAQIAEIAQPNVATAARNGLRPRNS